MQRAIGHVPGRLRDFQAQLVGSCSRSNQRFCADCKRLISYKRKHHSCLHHVPYLRLVGQRQRYLPKVAQGFEELVGYIERLVDLYNRDLAEGLDRLMALLPEGESQKSVEPFSLDVSILNGLIEKPAKHEAAYLVDMAKVEALDTVGENRKAVELLDRHVPKI